MARTEAQKEARRLYEARPEIREQRHAQSAASYKRNRAKRLANRKAYEERSEVKVMKSRWALKKYNLTPSEYDVMLMLQNFKCAICGRGEEKKFSSFRVQHLPLCVDHSHETGKVRSLLCSRCNAALGMLRDDPALCEAAGAYLRRHLP